MSQRIENHLDKMDLLENSNNKDMNEILLLKCENTISADEIVNLLNAHNIALRQHDENQDPRIGAYGPVTGIAIYVFAKDYEKALDIISPVLKEKNNTSSFCPKCGSEDVSPIIRTHDYRTALSLLYLFLILIPCIYMGLSYNFGFRSSIANKSALVMVSISFILMFVTKFYNVNYKCKKCGKKFNHR